MVLCDIHSDLGFPSKILSIWIEHKSLVSQYPIKYSEIFGTSWYYTRDFWLFVVTPKSTTVLQADGQKATHQTARSAAGWLCKSLEGDFEPHSGDGVKPGALITTNDDGCPS